MSISDLNSSKWGKSTPLSDLDKIRIECGIDEDFRKEFIANPSAVLRKYGIPVPDGLQINVVEDGSNLYNFNIPPYRGNDLSSSSLESVSGASEGTTWCTTCTATTPICMGSLASLTCVG